MTNGARWFDNTLKAEGVTKEQVIKFFEEQSDVERWAFEFEIGEGGYQHYQVRYVLKNKGTVEHEIERWADGFGADHNHVTVLGMKHPNWEYVTKEGTAICSWEYKSPLNKFKDLKLMPWQLDTTSYLAGQDERRILCIVDTVGNHGKTYLRKFLQARKVCAYIPQMRDMRDMMRISMNKYEADPKVQGFCFDLPRADGDKKNVEMWKAIEEIKNGYLYDDRYHFREMWIDSPRILVFTNDYPDLSVLSADRWEIYTIMDSTLEGTYLQKFAPNQEV